jgi:hypothetical protein
MVWFPGGKHEIEDATPERIAVRTLTETTGFKVSETNLRILERSLPDRISATCMSLALDPDRYRTLRKLLGHYGLLGRSSFWHAVHVI